MDVEVRHRISEQLVVHVARREHMLDHLRDGVNVAPVRCDFRGAQAREVRNVTISKDDDRMATSDGVSLEVCVTHASCVKRLTELVPTKPAPRPLFPGVPILRPCSCHCLCLPRGDPRQCCTAEANFKLMTHYRTLGRWHRRGSISAPLARHGPRARRSHEFTPYSLVPGAGIEPARPEGHGILSPERLPVPPPRRAFGF